MWTASRRMLIAARMAASWLAAGPGVMGCGGSGTPEGGACWSDSCSGHGSCDDSTGAAVCTCAPGYAGLRCDACASGFAEWPAGAGECVADPCSPDPCTEGGAVPGSCTQTGAATYSCACPQGTTWSAGACRQEPDCLDADGDGYGEGADCLGPDCDPADAGVHPGAVESCNCVDDDCDEATDEAFPELGQPCDGDGDQCTHGSLACAADGLGLECGADHDARCDDGSTPSCDMVVPACDCANEILAYQGSCYRCVNPASCAAWGQPGCLNDDECPPGQWCNPCGTSSCPVCEDCVAACRPQPDCLDVDHDGWGEGADCLGPDCAPEDAEIHPGAVESCNGVDDDCDEATDEAFPELGQACDGDGDQCARGSLACAADGLGLECGDDHDARCDDGSTPLCEMPTPACDCANEILAYQGSCYRCVNPASCAAWGQPGCLNDDECPPGQWCDPCGTSSCPACPDCVAACRPLRGR